MSTKIHKKRPVIRLQAKDERRRVSGLRLGEPPWRGKRPVAAPFGLFSRWTPERIPAARDRPCADLPVPGLWCVWDAAIAWRFIQQTTLSLATRGMRQMQRFAMRKTIQPEQHRFARQMGLVFKPRYQGNVSIHCPTCAALAFWVRWDGDHWRCMQCATWSTASELNRISLFLSRYQFALIIGAAGRAIDRRRDRVAQMLRKALFRRQTAGSIRFMWAFAIGTGLLEVPIRWRYARKPRGNERYQNGPFFQAVAPHVMQATIDTYLWPDAYLRAYQRMMGG